MNSDDSGSAEHPQQWLFTVLDEWGPGQEHQPVRLFQLGGGDRCDWAAAAVGAPVDSVLDIGCGYGWTIGRLAGKAGRLVGIDLDREAIESARFHYPQVQFILQSGAYLPFENDSFDAVILSDVIEHVGDWNKELVVGEAWRVLKPGGTFVFSAPYDGLLSWADPMDFKRRFPGIYRLYMRWTSYHPTTAMEIGHKHVSFEEVQALFSGKFVMETISYCGFFMPFFAWVLAVDARLHLLPRRWHEFLTRVQGWESGIPYGSILSYSIRIQARKVCVTNPLPSGGGGIAQPICHV